MGNRYLHFITAMAAVVTVSSLMPALAAGKGQAPKAQAGCPQVEDPAQFHRCAIEKVKTFNPPRTPDGRPDLQGLWGTVLSSWHVEGNDGDLDGILHGPQFRPEKSMVVDPADGKVPFQAWAAAKKKEFVDNYRNPTPEQLDPQARCVLGGVPRTNYQHEMQILQPPGHVVTLHEWSHAYRVIPLDGRPHAGTNVQLFMGDSRGHWEGNALVVDVTNHNDKNRFDVLGTFHSAALHVTERWTLVDSDTIHYEGTIEDPSVFTRPWKLVLPLVRIKQKGYELMEHACHEGNHALDQILKRAN